VTSFNRVSQGTVNQQLIQKNLSVFMQHKAHKALIVCTLVITAFASLSAQESYSHYPNPALAELIDHCHAAAGLNACPYDMIVVPGPDTKAPHGYKPFYISHYGRHGSRSGWDQDRYELIISTLQAAKNEGLLSAKGDSLLNETRFICNATDGMDGRLTPRGQREHRAIASRMHHRFRKVFRQDKKDVRVIGSVVPRCLVSMAAFTNQLQMLEPRLNITMDCGERIQPQVSNETPEELQSPRKIILDSLYAAMDADFDAAVIPLFTSTEAAARFVPQTKKFAHAMFGAARTSYAFDPDFDMYRFLPLDVIYSFMDYNNLRMYLGQCNSAQFGDLRMAAATGVSENIVRCADEAIAGNGPASDLRFGHDYPLLALCSMMGLKGVGERYYTTGARKHFSALNCTPFAGNLQMIFYRSRKADSPVLVKVLLNENETEIPSLKPFEGPYYRWEDIREKISQ